MAETLDEFFKKRIVNAEPVEWKGPFPDPYKSLSPEESQSFEAENAKVLAKSKPTLVADKPINVETKVKEVAQPVKPEVAAVAAASPKVTPEMLDQIRASLAQPALAEVSSSETLPPQAAVAPEKIDLKAIREQVEQEGPQLGLTDALLGLIPVGVDAMTGGYGGGLDVGAKYYTERAKDNEKRKQTLEDFLLKSAQARSIAGAKKSASAKLPTASNLVPVERDGKVVYEWAGKAAGMQKPEKESTSLGLEDRMKLLQEAARLRALNKKDKLTQDEEKEKRDLEMTLSDRWEKNKFTMGTRDVTASYNRIAKISPENSSPIDDMGAIFDLMKALDPSSVVRESEQAMAIGARSYGDVVSYFGSIMSGERKLTPGQVRNIQKFAKRLHDSRIQEQKKVDAGFLQKAESYGLNPANVVQKISENHAVKWKGKTIFFNTQEEADAAAAVPGAEKVK